MSVRRHRCSHKHSSLSVTINSHPPFSARKYHQFKRLGWFVTAQNLQLFDLGYFDSPQQPLHPSHPSHFSLLHLFDPKSHPY